MKPILSIKPVKKYSSLKFNLSNWTNLVNSIGIDLPYRVSSFNDEILFLRTYLFLLLLLIDRGILSDFAARNKEESKQRSNYGKFKKY